LQAGLGEGAGLVFASVAVLGEGEGVEGLWFPPEELLGGSFGGGVSPLDCRTFEPEPELEELVLGLGLGELVLEVELAGLEPEFDAAPPKMSF
jgi:hypothetical protein